MAECRQGSYSFLKKSFKRLRFCAKIALRVFSFSFHFLKKCIEENRGCSRGMVYPKKKKKTGDEPNLNKRLSAHIGE